VPPTNTPLESARAYLDQDDIESVGTLLRAGALSGARARATFENALAQLTGTREAIALASPHVAAQLAYHVLGVGPGRALLASATLDEALCGAVFHVGGPLEFVDLDPRSGNLDVRALEQRLERGPTPAVVIATHAAGLPCDMEWLIALKRRHDFALLEDASEALGARYRVEGRWYHVGEHPEVELALLSFEPQAHVTTGRGAALVTVHAELAQRLRAHVSSVRAAEPPAREPVGQPRFAPALSELQAVLGASQLRKLPEFLSARAEIATAYLATLRDFHLPHPGGVGAGAEREHAWGRFVLRTEPGERHALRAWLRRAGIEVDVPPPPLALEPWFRGRQAPEAFPNAGALARSAVHLPLHPALSNADQERVIAALAAWQKARAAA
jgi:dTDP-4-amino-4,6-dideoxygalactose transaminase